MTPRVSILGIGNVLMGDDALGPWVVELLQSRFSFAGDVEVVEVGTPGMDLTVHLADREAVLVVDTVKARGAPGELRRYELPEILERSPVLATSPHDPGLREALLTLQFAGGLPGRLVLVGVIPEEVDAGRGLTAPVQAAVPAALDALLGEAAALGAVPTPRTPPGLPNIWWEREGRRLDISGTVQGVGMRPFVHRAAYASGVSGRVFNHAEGVTIEAFGPATLLDAFQRRLEDERPPAARYERIEVTPLPDVPLDAFTIEPSPVPEGGEARRTTIPPDLATCAACEAEIRDPADRRHRYPFTNCTDCGPRFTIVREVPYDRPGTTMAGFEMCPACRREYEDVHDRRFHAQPNACPVCGPRLALVAPTGAPVPADDPLASAAEALAQGRIVAVKGLGGFHLACDATRPEAVRLLRERKRREEKPLAVMVADLAAVEALGSPTPEERALLTGPERPIVLVRRRPGTPLAPEVAPDTPWVGFMLPYTPLHHLLLTEAGRPLVMTSGNLSDEPIATDNDEALERLGTVADLFLMHDRPIESRADDSVARLVDGRPTLLRRSRGFVPQPVRLGRPVRPLLALGGHLKNTFCLARGHEAVLGPHIGDLEGLGAVEALEAAVDRFLGFLHLTPEAVACDLHPDYASTRLARARADALGVPLVQVQHHHAHVVACMAEHGLTGKVLALSWDGTGLGADDTAWGGELLLAGLDGYERLGTLRPLRLAGGDAAIRQPWRVALAMLDDAYEGAPPLDRLDLFRAQAAVEVQAVGQMLATGLNVTRAHGAGRWFDAVGALVLGRGRAAFEGQVAMALEAAAAPEGSPYPLDLVTRADGLLEVDLRPAVRALTEALIAGEPASTLAARFHATLAAAGARLLGRARETVGSHPVVLTGGVFQNARLARLLSKEGGPDGEVYLHRNVPPGDGGIALGQAVAADAILRREGA